MLEKGESIGVISVDRIFRDKAVTIDKDIRVLEIVASIIGQYVTLWSITVLRFSPYLFFNNLFNQLFE